MLLRSQEFLRPKNPKPCSLSIGGLAMRTHVAFINRKVIDVLKNCSLVLVCCAVAAAIAQAQAIGGKISGTVSDPAGAVIRKATVTATNEGTGAARRTTTDENGYYTLPELPIGFYALKIEG